VSAPLIAFLSPERDIGTTTLVYHLAWAYADPSRGPTPTSASVSSSWTSTQAAR